MYRLRSRLIHSLCRSIVIIRMPDLRRWAVHVLSIACVCPLPPRHILNDFGRWKQRRLYRLRSRLIHSLCRSVFVISMPDLRRWAVHVLSIACVCQLLRRHMLSDGGRWEQRHVHIVLRRFLLECVWRVVLRCVSDLCGRVVPAVWVI